MDLRIVVTDEDSAVLYERVLYRDGSDSDAACKIADVIDLEFGPPQGDEVEG